MSRCWAYETSLAIGMPLENSLPKDLYFYEYYKDSKYLHVYDESLKGKCEGSFWTVEDIEGLLCEGKEYRERIL